MRIFSAEYKRDYSSYTFGYANYCVKESGDEWHSIYDLGYLPYTGNYSLDESIFYMARSLRVNLANFTPSSENRRIDRKMEDISILTELVPKDDFRFDNEFYDFVQTYAEQRFQGGEMGRDRLEYLRSRDELTHILVYSDQTTKLPIGYVFCCVDDEMLHYWYSFFDLALLESRPIGKWLMYKTLHLAQEWQKKYVYLGTCYGTKSLYKVRDFKGIEFYDGGGWSADQSMIKAWCKSDDVPLEVDRFKIKT